MKKSILFLFVTLLIVSLLSCQSNTAVTTSTVSGRVISIEGSTVTIEEGGNTTPTMAKGTNPPSMPEGTTPPSMPEGGTPPEKPEGDNAAARAEAMEAKAVSQTTLDLSKATFKKSNSTVSLSDLKVGDFITVTLTDGVPSSVEISSQQEPSFGGGSTTVEQGSSANTISEDTTIEGESYTSTGDNENALRVDGATVTLTNINVDKASGASSNAETGDFYGMNAALLATNGAQVTITGATITSSAQNGNGVFSYGSGTVVTISDSTITTTKDNSGGIQTTGGGTTIASNLNITTSGSSAAAIRSDRGGGTVTVTGGSYTSRGLNSPAVYSTATITVKDATLTAEGSEALVIEGQNSITLENCTVSGKMSETQGSSSDINVHNVMIYQSMSGDAEVGTSSFSMVGGTLTSNSGDMFYITNTSCEFLLKDVEVVDNTSGNNLLTISGNNASHGWGSAGSNGAQVTAVFSAETISGSIEVDKISTLDLTLKDNSTFTGSINIIENAEGGTAVADNAVITIEEGSVWTLTFNSSITSLENNGIINYNGYTLTLADGTVYNS